MPEADELLRVARQWVQKAQNDLKNAIYTLQMGEDCPTDTVCFHAQQCVEKYIKALLVFRGTAFPKTHNIRVLRTLSAEASPEAGQEGSGSPDAVCCHPALSRCGDRRAVD